MISFKIDFRSDLVPTWPQLGPQTFPKWSQVGFKIDPRWGVDLRSFCLMYVGPSFIDLLTQHGMAEVAKIVDIVQRFYSFLIFC